MGSLFVLSATRRTPTKQGTKVMWINTEQRRLRRLRRLRLLSLRPRLLQRRHLQRRHLQRAVQHLQTHAGVKGIWSQHRFFQRARGSIVCTKRAATGTLFLIQALMTRRGFVSLPNISTRTTKAHALICRWQSRGCLWSAVLGAHASFQPRQHWVTCISTNLCVLGNQSVWGLPCADRHMRPSLFVAFLSNQRTILRLVSQVHPCHHHHL